MEKTTALARSEDNLAISDLWREAEWQRLWLAVQAQQWSSLALIPAAPGAPEDFALTIAVTLAKTGIVHLGVPIHVADGARIQMADLATFGQEVARCKEYGDRVLMALAPIDENPVSVTLAKSADFALLCILLEDMDSSQSKKTVAAIGQNRFIGSVMFHPSQLNGAARR
ncbi:MAG TPA: hypothetical protein VFQ61_27615 [Polyangiaceae bacterium]|nr:hypothetical protein [Polyangiaceae bacterium]